MNSALSDYYSALDVHMYISPHVSLLATKHNRIKTHHMMTTADVSDKGFVWAVGMHQSPGCEISQDD
jgi:hypothetical protein